jgi:hypothetical protein
MMMALVLVFFKKLRKIFGFMMGGMAMEYTMKKQILCGDFKCGLEIHYFWAFI